MKYAILILALARFCNAQQYQFPDGFLFGVATASYQVEGAWNESGKGENIWDRLTHAQSHYVIDGSTGDVACDTYHKTSEDVQLLKNLGVDFYRFSLSWSRILPTGHANYINQDGVRYYNELIDELLANDIQPLITLYHWDLPQPLQEIGGWPNPFLADLFEDYANVAFNLFGDRVKEWLTFNEPYQTCAMGYSLETLAPAYTQDGIGGYLCGHTLLLAHAKAYRLYESTYKDTQQGRVGITVHGIWNAPSEDSDSEDDQAAAEREIQFSFGWWLHPIFTEAGDYPPIMRERIDELSQEEGFARSRLPSFTDEEIELLRGSADFLGFNHYTTYVCTSLDENSVARPSHRADTGALCSQPDDWEGTASTWLKVVPEGFRSLLNWIKNNYNNPEVIVTESGFSQSDSNLNDCRRVNYYNSYLAALLEAIHEDGCNITAYTAWSFLDNFEWMRGYTERFGLYNVDFEDPDRPRTPRMSSYVYKNIIENRQIDWDYTPEGFEVCEW